MLSEILECIERKNEIFLRIKYCRGIKQIEEVNITYIFKENLFLYLDFNYFINLGNKQNLIKFN